jgi:tRNA pseudouridine38-40 synthase
MNIEGIKPFRVRLLLSYDGTQYCGWQSQSNYKNKLSIQILLQRALEKIYKESIICVASGRTDSGAHAMGQNVHFNLSKDPTRVPLLLALRTLLPPAIVARKAWLAPNNFSAISSALAKTYKYKIVNSKFPSALRYSQSCWYPHDLDLAQLNEFSQIILGRHNFKSFQSSSGRPPKSSFRRIYKVGWSRTFNNTFCFSITGNGFLTQMVRNLVACQLVLLRSGGGVEDFKRILSGENRRLIGKPAPASGLFLYRVYYPKDILQKCKEI